MGIYRWLTLIVMGGSVIAVPEWEQWREILLIGLVAINGFELEGLRSRVDGDLDTIRVDLDGLTSSVDHDLDGLRSRVDGDLDLIRVDLDGLRSRVDGDLDLIRDNLDRLTFRDNT